MSGTEGFPHGEKSLVRRPKKGGKGPLMHFFLSLLAVGIMKES